MRIRWRGDDVVCLAFYSILCETWLNGVVFRVMTVDSGYIALLEDLLAGLGSVQSKRMFGGAGLFCDGVMFALIADDVLYLKADDDSKSDFEAEGLGPFVYSGKNKPIEMSYWRAPDRLLDDGDEMLAWARVALAVAKRAAEKRSKKSAGKKRRSG